MDIEMIQWLEKNGGKKPRMKIIKKGKILKLNDLAVKERYERNLAQRFNNSIEGKLLNEYKGRPIEEVPKEYREKIVNLRKYGLGLTTYEEIIKWLEKHNGKKPRGSIFKEGKFLKIKEMTEEEKYEVNLYRRFNNSLEKKILDEYAGRPIEEVLEEYREKIANLRKYRLGEEEKTAFEEMIQWLEENEGKKARGVITKKGKKLKTEEMTEKEKYEVNLYQRFNHSIEKEVLDKYKGRSIEEVPKEYRERVRKLRKYGLGITAYDEIIKWLNEHKGKMPRRGISREGKRLRRKEMTEQEKYEVNLYERFKRVLEKLNEYEGKTIEEVPEEYREQISTLRKIGQLGKQKDEKIENRMKKALAKQVKNNQETREKLSNPESQRNNKDINDNSEEIER